MTTWQERFHEEFYRYYLQSAYQFPTEELVAFIEAERKAVARDILGKMQFSSDPEIADKLYKSYDLL